MDKYTGRQLQFPAAAPALPGFAGGAHGCRSQLTLRSAVSSHCAQVLKMLTQLILGQTCPHAVIHQCITGQSEGPVLAYSEARGKQQKVPLRGRSGHGAARNTPHCCTRDKPFTLTWASAEQIISSGCIPFILPQHPRQIHAAPGSRAGLSYIRDYTTLLSIISSQNIPTSG